MMKALRKNAMRSLLTLIAAAFGVIGAAGAQPVAIINGQVHTMDGRGVIEGGTVVIVEGRITAVGADAAIPDGARVIDAGGMPVTPGLIAVHTQIGLVEIGAAAESNDDDTSRDFGLGAALDVQYALNPESTLIPVNRIEGVTRAIAAPSPATGLFAGQGAAIHLAGGDDILMTPRIAMYAAIDSAGLAVGGGSRVAVWTGLREALDDARDYAANARAYQTSRPRDHRLPLSDIRALGPVVAGDMPLVLAVNRASELRQAIRLKNEYDLEIIVLGGDEGWKVGRELAAADVPVILNALNNAPADFASLGATLENAARLQAAGVRIAILGAGSHNARLMTQHAGNAVANGLPHAAALAALTSNPARMFGLYDRVGSLTAGKDADVVIWDGDPLELSTRPTSVFIRGREMPLDARTVRLRERYRDVSRGETPLAYQP